MRYIYRPIYTYNSCLLQSAPRVARKPTKHVIKVVDGTVVNGEMGRKREMSSPEII